MEDVVEELYGRVRKLKMLGTEFAALFLKRRVQPLQHRAHPMSLYTGAKDSTRVSSVNFSDKELLDEVRRLTKLTQKDTIPLEPSTRPFEASFPPPQVSSYFHLISCRQSSRCLSTNAIVFPYRIAMLQGASLLVPRVARHPRMSMKKPPTRGLPPVRPPWRM